MKGVDLFYPLVFVSFVSLVGLVIYFICLVLFVKPVITYIYV